MRWPGTTVGSGNLWLPRLSPGVGPWSDLVGTSKRLPYADHGWDAYDVLIRFPLQGVHQFESPRLLD
jgi:hypothetical protein